jgi:hypothetical protein
VPVGEAMMACVLADHLLRHRGVYGARALPAIAEAHASSRPAADRQIEQARVVPAKREPL